MLWKKNKGFKKEGSIKKILIFRNNKKTIMIMKSVKSIILRIKIKRTICWWKMIIKDIVKSLNHITKKIYCSMSKKQQKKRIKREIKS